jgi:hypothetical protein
MQTYTYEQTQKSTSLNKYFETKSNQIKEQNFHNFQDDKQLNRLIEYIFKYMRQTGLLGKEGDSKNPIF